MKTLVFILVAFSTLIATAKEAPTPAEIVRPASRAEVRKMSTAERIRYNGGWLFSNPTGKVIRAVNAQKIVPLSTIDPMINGFKVAMGLTIFPHEGKPESVFSVVKQGFAIEKTGAVLALIDDPNAPRILTAPEECWGAVNVRALALDNPSEEVLKKRVIKESWRALSIALGAADTMYRPCLLAPIHTLAELDANPSLVVSPEPFSKMMDNAEAVGIRKVKQTSYRKACYEGWAPVPTNVYQQAIWDMVHAEKERGPTNALQIKP